ncbi:MAG: MFS transporter [Acutalibacteraceae bacterium]
MTLVEKAKGAVGNFKDHWSTPAQGKYMPYKEVAAYAGGGIGAYMIITLGTACLLATNNTLLSSTLGIDPKDMYIMYVIAVLANIPLTGIRANIIDNTRNKAGKYRPYIVTMALPTAVICSLMVWFPYNKLGDWLGDGMLFGETRAYIAKCAIIMVLNLLLHFFYYFFYDAYENLIHVLSPNTQERTDVASVKSIVYSFAPTIVNLITPIIASNIFHSNMTDIRVYRLLYPILSVLGILLCIVVYKYTEEKIVQARTHIIQIKFIDALKAVAKNKYFWIISLAGWLGFLEASYANILFWLYNYGGACSGDVYGIVFTVYGNASLWGMLLAPFCVKKWGKRAVLVVTNIFNIVFILMMLPFVNEINNLTIWLVMGCLYLNAFMGSFMHILNPAIQADIRDYQQYKTGERIDGMFSAVATIGTVITLLTSSVLPAIYEKGGLTKTVAAKVTSDPAVLGRLLGDGKTVGEILAEQLANGQDNYNNALSALYDPNILLSLIKVLIIVAAVGALMNVIPYAWYDFDEKKQKSVVNVLKIRAMFEDYSNGALADESLIESVDIINSSRELSQKELLTEKEIKAMKLPKKEKNAAIKANEEIEIARFVCDELDKFSTPSYAERIAVSKQLYDAGLEGIVNSDVKEIDAALKEAKAMPKKTKAEKDDRTFMVDLQRTRKNALKAYNKYYAGKAEFVQPDMAVLDSLFEKEDKCDEKLKALYEEKRQAKKDKNSADITRISAEIKETQATRSEVRKSGEKEMDRHAYFARAAKPYLDSKKLLDQMENYSHLEDIISKYDAAKLRLAAAE